MSRRQFTEEQINILRQNPYVFSVTGTRLTLTREFKESLCVRIVVSEESKLLW